MKGGRDAGRGFDLVRRGGERGAGTDASKVLAPGDFYFPASGRSNGWTEVSSLVQSQKVAKVRTEPSPL